MQGRNAFTGCDLVSTFSGGGKVGALKLVVKGIDLEILGLENIWIELSFKHKRVLFGLFYRPQNSDQLYYNSLEDSVHLAIDTGIDDILSSQAT